MRGLLTKPVKLDEIVAIISQVLAVEWIYESERAPARSNDKKKQHRRTTDAAAAGPSLVNSTNLAMMGDVHMLNDKLSELRLLGRRQWTCGGRTRIAGPQTTI